jgi:hypothetical protein
MNMFIFAFMPGLGPMELIVLGMSALLLIIPIWAIIDAAGRADKQWAGIGNSKGLWIAMMALSAVLCTPIGAVISIYYLAVMRPRLDAAGGPLV